MQGNEDGGTTGLLRASLSLIHIQRVYNISLDELARGRLLRTFSSPLTAVDLYVIGSIAQTHSFHTEARLWIAKAQEVLAEYKPIKSQTESPHAHGNLIMNQYNVHVSNGNRIAYVVNMHLMEVVR